jgi:alanine dehydrogenase
MDTGAMYYMQDTERHLHLDEVNRAVESAFAEQGKGQVQMPPKVYVTFPEGDFRTMPAYLPSQSIAGVKIVNVHPNNPLVGLPTVMALTIILDIATGQPIAIINATGLTDIRTGAAGAVACKYLSPKNDVVLGLVGTGRQALAQVRAIAHELHITEILAWSRSSGHVDMLARDLPGFTVRYAGIEKVCSADVVVTTTPSTTPLVKSEWISEGTHINAIGADAPGKEELDPALLQRAQVYVDDMAQAVHSGEINVPVKKGLFSPGDIAGTLGGLVIGTKRETSKDQITIFDSTGLAIQDLAIAKIAMRCGKRINLPFP